MSELNESPGSEPPYLVDAMRERSVLLGLGYRLLGSLADAEDAVQETYMRYWHLPEDKQREIVNVHAWLMKTTRRVCFDMLKTARSRRERYVGQWLPEPVSEPGRWNSQNTATGVDPAERVEMDESVSMALLIVLESMTPAERVAFILHDVFGYAYTEIGDILGRTPGACRQLASSARRRVREEHRSPVEPGEHAAAVRAFKNAWQTGDFTSLIKVLDPNATAITDGGGIVSASIKPLHGPEAIARFMLGIIDRQPDLSIVEGLVNGQLGLIATDSNDDTLAVIAFETTGTGTIKHVWAVRNPEKLAIWAESIDAQASHQQIVGLGRQTVVYPATIR